MNKHKLAIFDLDGTLVDTSEGIYECYKYTLNKLGKKPPTHEDLNGVIGGSLLKSFQERFSLSKEEAALAVKVYREYYGIVGYKSSKLYDGIVDVLKYLKNNGYKIAVATLKAEHLAIALFSNLGILSCFDLVHGVDINDTLTKSDLISMCVSELNVTYEQSVLIGDSLNDYHGANSTGVDFIPVSYGFGFKPNQKKLENVYCDFINTPSGLKYVL